MTIQIPGGVGSSSGFPAPKKIDLPLAKASAEPVQAPKTEQPAVQEPAADLTEQRRAEAVVRAAESVFKNYFAVNDNTFSIFKDGSGQYITRFTSLRDGSVTYIPEPKMLQYMERLENARESLIQIKV
jgi:hypothetical protein